MVVYQYIYLVKNNTMAKFFSGEKIRNFWYS
nr:MAG TPA: hypothetical protein [Caudoviricetes sp.]DAY21454.1 MAG TPA: hypothetical protein [Caudoviricetes sp.]